MKIDEKYMMSQRWPLKYGGAAITLAIVIIAGALIANPSMLPQPVAAQSTFAVLLTDPPVVPAGTTQLNLTYTNLSIHVTYPDNTSTWLPIEASGTVNLFSLVNVSQTIAATTIPINSTVDRVQFTISNVTAQVNNQFYNVTSLSDTFVVNVANAKVNQTLSGVLVDFNPTLVQIQANDVNDTTVYYYVLVPSANAVIINGLSQDHAKVGTIVQLEQNNRVRITKVQEEFNRNVTIVSASLGLNGNATSLSVTLRNDGNTSFKIFGLTLHGEFNATRDAKNLNNNGHGPKNREESAIKQNVHPDTIPFKISGTSLTPLFGTNDEREDNHGDAVSALILQPKDTVTLTFTGTFALHTEDRHSQNPAMVITPVIGNDYTIRLMGEGYQTYIITAKS
jgi:hypothetical protein